MKKVLLFSLMVAAALVGKATGLHVGTGQTYATISAASAAVAPGDTIYVHANAKNAPYTDAPSISLTGTSSKWITICNYKTDSVSIVNEYQLVSAQYVKITGLNFDGGNKVRSSGSIHLLFMEGSSCGAGHDFIIENCKFTNLNNTGDGSTGDMLKIDNSTNFQVLNCLFENGTNITDGIGLNGDRNGLVKNCTFENIGPVGAGCDGSHCKGGSIYITYQANMFINCGGSGLDIGGDTGTPYYCPAYNASTSFESDSCSVFSNIFIGGTTGVRLGSCWNAQIYNNTCFKLRTFAFRVLNESENPIYVKNNNIYNNIITTNSTYGIYMNFTGQTTTDYYSTEHFYNNLFYNYMSPPGTVAWNDDFNSPVVCGADVAGSIVADPMFNDTTTRDFSLKSLSKAIKAGYNISSPATDYNGHNFGATRSIGAIEYSSNIGTGVQDYKDLSEVIVYPNPSKGQFNISLMGTGSIQKVEVYNMMGQLVYSVIPTGYLSNMNLSSLPSGVYKAVFRMNSGSVSGKSIVLD